MNMKQVNILSLQRLQTWSCLCSLLRRNVYLFNFCLMGTDTCFVKYRFLWYADLTTLIDPILIVSEYMFRA